MLGCRFVFVVLIVLLFAVDIVLLIRQIFFYIFSIFAHGQKYTRRSAPEPSIMS